MSCRRLGTPGAIALPTFQPERSTEPLPIPAGDHLIEIRTAGAAASEEPLLTQTVTVPAGFQGSLVAHLDASGNPTLSAFADVAPKSEAIGLVGAGGYQVAVTPAAGGTPLAPPQAVQYADGTANFMYLIGSQADGTLGWAAVQVGNLQTPPAMIQTGDGSTETSTDGAGVTFALLAAAGAVAAGGAAIAVRRRLATTR